MKTRSWKAGETVMLHNPQVPVIGGRLLTSSLAAVLCILVYALRIRLPIGNGIPFYSVLAALWCMQPYPDTTRCMAAQRSMGTLIGAAYGHQVRAVLPRRLLGDDVASFRV